MKATSLLKKQHQEVKGLFRKIDKTEDASGRQDLMTQIIEKLTVHSTIEEEIFYPAVRGLGSQKAEDIILEALEEHHVVKLVLEELPTMDPEDEHFSAKMTVLSELVEHHAEEEEDEMQVIGILDASAPILFMSCSPPIPWITEPAHRNSRALKKAWVIRWKMAAE